MAALRKLLFSFIVIIAVVIFLFLTEKALAQVVINEFVPNANQEWVEFYNKGNSSVDLVDYYFDDDNTLIIDSQIQTGTSDLGSDPIKLSGVLQASTTCYLDLTDYLNNNGDTPSLFLSNGNTIDSYTYATTQSDKSFSRIPDGGDWQANQTPTKSSNKCADLASLPTPSPTSTSSPTNTPTPTFTPTPTPKPIAIYKINEVKDKDGEILNSVKVYVDNIYIHHYTPEVLTFCDNCQCDTSVGCGFGQHTIKLEKTGYEDWSKEITINPNTSDEVSPVMIFLESNSTSSPTPTPKILTPTQKISPTPTPKKSNQTATGSGEILGEEVASFSAFYPYEATDETKENEATSEAKNMILPKIFLVGGLLLLFISACWLWYNLRDYTSR